MYMMQSADKNIGQTDYRYFRKSQQSEKMYNLITTPANLHTIQETAENLLN